VLVIQEKTVAYPRINRNKMSRQKCSYTYLSAQDVERVEAQAIVEQLKAQIDQGCQLSGKRLCMGYGPQADDDFDETSHLLY
jgi:hypothetical protein